MHFIFMKELIHLHLESLNGAAVREGERLINRARVLASKLCNLEPKKHAGIGDSAKGLGAVRI